MQIFRAFIFMLRGKKLLFKLFFLNLFDASPTAIINCKDGIWQMAPNMSTREHQCYYQSSRLPIEHSKYKMLTNC